MTSVTKMTGPLGENRSAVPLVSANDAHVASQATLGDDEWIDLSDRSVRLSHICSHLSKDVDYPLLKGFKLSNHWTNELEAMANLYCWETLTQAHPEQRYALSKTFVEDNWSNLISAPNRTPNGLLLPKRENSPSFNMLHKTVSRVMMDYGFASHASGFHLPISLRLIDGVRNPEASSRPRATTKVHTDVWAAEPCHAMMVFMTLVGDFEKTGIRFFELPHGMPPELVGPLVDFDHGAWLRESCVPTPYVVEPGMLYICDPLLLHGTYQEGGGPRMSIDFRFLAQETVASDLYVNSPRLQNYASPEDWFSIGDDLMMATDARLKSFGSEDFVDDSYSAEVYTVPMMP